MATSISYSVPFLLPVFALLTACGSSSEPEKVSLPLAADTLVVLDSQPGEELSTGETWEEPVPVQPVYSASGLVEAISWQRIDTGLALAEIPASIRCDIGDSRITVLRVDPKLYAFGLFCAGDRDGFARTAKEWAQEEGLIAAFNAGMFQMDGITNAGLLKHLDYVNNSRFNAKYKSVAAFNPLREDLPPFRIADVECDDWDTLKDQYQSYTQCLRMVSCERKNVWSRQQRYWSMVAIGEDAAGHALFCFTRSPYSVHDFNKMLLELPLGLQRLMYLEGGPETSFYLNHRGTVVEKMGSYETGFNENDSNDEFWSVPNVIGIKTRSAPDGL